MQICHKFKNSQILPFFLIQNRTRIHIHVLHLFFSSFDDLLKKSWSFHRVFKSV
ncbi:hypothetical protein HanPSC8_Chr03g0107661 [Helianthus annuus]|nr:hypothetical protein HanPSC8_Chr03g0107661 [Helianthus annuus]